MPEDRVKGCALVDCGWWAVGGWEEADMSNDSFVRVEMRYMQKGVQVVKKLL